MGEELEPVSVDSSFVELALMETKRAVAGGKCRIKGGFREMRDVNMPSEIIREKVMLQR